MPASAPSDDEIRLVIRSLRGQRVILDTDLAPLLEELDRILAA